MLSRAYTPSSGINCYYPLRFCNGRRCFDTGCAYPFTISFRIKNLGYPNLRMGNVSLPFRELVGPNGGYPMSHPIKSTRTARAPVNIQRDVPVPPQWPSYRGDSTFVGASPRGRVAVYVDSSLGDQAMQNAQDLVNDADRVATANDGIFGTTGGPVSVILFALGGATHGRGR